MPSTTTREIIGGGSNEGCWVTRTREIHATSPESGFPLAYVNYPRAEWSRADAWKHCQKNLPLITIGDRLITPLIRTAIDHRTGTNYPTNPYRHGHTDDQWRWQIVDWRDVGERERERRTKLPRTRWERLMEEATL